MKCPNCYSRNINNKKCEMCGRDITTFQIKKNTIKKTIIIVAIIVFLILTIIAIVNFDQIKSAAIMAKIRRNYKVIIKKSSLLFFGITSVLLMMKGSYNRNEIKLYESYLLGKIVDYRPSITKGLYHPIVEYEVDEKKYRVVGKSTKVKELEGLVGVRYKKNNPYEALIDGEKNANLEFAIGLVMFVAILTIMII